MALKALVIHDKDNMCNLIGPGNKGDQVECDIAKASTETVTLLDDIPSNHKFARVDIKVGDTICKYGMSIGKASKDIAKGEYAHVHNIDSNYGQGHLKS